MPNRLIKDSICTSDNLNELTPEQEVFFYRLIVNCDDYGRMDARAAILSARLYPLKRKDDKFIKSMITALVKAKLIFTYIVDGRQYIQIETWEDHQQVRSHKSKYPAPFDGEIEQMISDDIRSTRNPIQSESESESESNMRKRKDEFALDSRFDKFWAAYPRKIARKDAKKAFEKLELDDEALEKVIESVKQQSESEQWKKDSGKFIPYPATWLNGHRWEDELPVSNGPAPPGQVRDFMQYVSEG